MSSMNSRSGTFVLAQQVDARAFFAGVTVEVSSSSGLRQPRVVIDSDVDPRWHSAVRFGVAYAWAQLAHDEPNLTPGVVRVTSVEWQPSDSTDMTIVFASANALWESLGRKPRETPTLDAP